MSTQVSSFLKAALITVLLFLGIAHAHGQTTLQEHIDKFCKGSTCISADEIVSIADRAANRYGVKREAVLAIIHIESKFNIKAKNGSSVGLMQTLLKYHRSKFMGRDYFDPQDNVFVGTSYYSYCLEKHKGDVPKSFSCYNGYGKGDPGYRDKAMKAMRLMHSLVKSYPPRDHLATFIKKLNV